MLCQECNKRPATVHLTRFVNNQKTELHLCQECAQNRGDLNVFTPFTINDLLASFLDMGKSSSMPDKTEPEKCSVCGMNYAQFRKTGLLGCENCYKSFKDELTPILKRMQGGAQHTGKVPKRAGTNLRMRRHIADLKAELQKAIESEAFEEAARLRDQIRDMENQISSN